MQITLTNSELSELEDKLSFNTDPVFEQSDVECVIFAFRVHGKDAMDWLRARRFLFQDRSFYPYLCKVVCGIKEKRKTVRV